METADLVTLVAKIQRIKAETPTLELKSAEKGCPKKLYDTLSSFSNQDEGGVIVFGVSEDDYRIVGVYDAEQLEKDVIGQCKQMDPEVRIHDSGDRWEGRRFCRDSRSGVRKQARIL